MRPILLLAALCAIVAGCATYERGGYGRYRYEGSDWTGRHGGGGPLRGPGVGLLDPWLAETGEGSLLVRAGWLRARRGFVDRRTAERANAWFRRYADTDRDLCLTDHEIRTALVWAARDVRRSLGRRQG